MVLVILIMQFFLGILDGVVCPLGLIREIIYHNWEFSKAGVQRKISLNLKNK